MPVAATGSISRFPQSNTCLMLYEGTSVNDTVGVIGACSLPSPP